MGRLFQQKETRACRVWVTLLVLSTGYVSLAKAQDIANAMKAQVGQAQIALHAIHLLGSKLEVNVKLVLPAMTW